MPPLPKVVAAGVAEGLAGVVGAAAMALKAGERGASVGAPPG